MATQTLAEAAKYTDNEIVAGVAETIIKINPLWDVIPFMGYTGPGVVINQENARGDAQFLDVGDTITAKAASTVNQKTFQATTVLGDAELNLLLQAQQESDGVDQMAIEIASKAREISDKMEEGMLTGDGVAPNMTGFATHVDGTGVQHLGNGSARPLTFELLDTLLNTVKTKGARVDFMTTNGKQLNKMRTLIRALGGASMERVTVGFGDRSVEAYNGVPVFQTDFQGSVETASTTAPALTGAASSSLYAGNWDDGSRKIGVAMIHPMRVPAGISVNPIGQLEGKDEQLVRVKAYVESVTFNPKALSRLSSLN